MFFIKDWWDCGLIQLFLSVFRIRIRLDPYYLAGSGSTSWNVDPDPGSKKNRDKLTYKSTKIIYNFLKKESLILFNIREKEAQNYKKKHRWVLYLCICKVVLAPWGDICLFKCTLTVIQCQQTLRIMWIIKKKPSYKICHK